MRGRRLAARAWGYRTRVRWRGLIPVILFGLSILFTVTWVQHVNQEFCQVVTSVTVVPVAKPADPGANPSRESNYELYRKFVALSGRLGC